MKNSALLTSFTKAFKPSKHKVADIINQQWNQVLHDRHFNTYQIRILDAIRKCRTAALGGHLYRCSGCGYLHKRYNSCRNRHCPTCQNTQKEKWILQREASLINTQYFHIVFTIPADLNEFCMVYPRQMYSNLYLKHIGLSTFLRLKWIRFFVKKPRHSPLCLRFLPRPDQFHFLILPDKPKSFRYIYG